MYLACFIIAYSIFQIPKEVNAYGTIPLRIIILLIFAALVLCLTVYFAEEVVWKTIVKLLGYIVALAVLVGIPTYISYLQEIQSQFKPLWAIAILVGPVSAALLLSKVINSKWLN